MFSLHSYTILYLIQLLLLSLALGTVTLHQPRMFLVPRSSRFLSGVCLPPFILGLWMLLLGAIFPGGPRWLFVFLPSVAAIGVLFYYGPRSWRRLGRDYARRRRVSKNHLPAYLSYLLVTAVVGVVIVKLTTNGQAPIIAHDALVYLSEALPFAQERSLSAITDFRGAPDGTHRGDIHGFLFPAFLSHALLTTGSDLIGYPHDHAARIAFQLTFGYMLLSILALAGTTKRLGAGALALILLLQVPQFEYISSNNSRDAYRIIPLALLGVTLVGLSSPRLHGRLPVASLLPLVGLAAFALAGHTIGGFVVISLALAWLIGAVIQKARRWNIFLVLGAIGLGLLLGGSHYITAYLETGSITGDNVFKEAAIAGTPLLEKSLQQEAERLAGSTGSVEYLTTLLGRDGYRLSIPGLLAALVALLVGLKVHRRDQTTLSFFIIGLMTLTTTLPFTGLFDLGQIKLSDWFILNFRYALHWYPFAAVCLALLISYGYHYLTSTSLSRSFKLSGSAVLLVFVAVSGFSAYATVSAPAWRVFGHSYTGPWVIENLGLLEDVIQELPVDKRLLIEDSRFNYYLNNRGILIYSQPTWNLLQAKSEGEVQAALQRLNIGAVLLQETNIRDWWDQLPMLSYLNDSGQNVLVASHQFRVYIPVENEARREALINTYLEKARLSPLYLAALINSGYFDAYENQALTPLWQGPETIPMQDLPVTAPPLAISGFKGDFSFHHLPGEKVLRVTPRPDQAHVDNLIIQFGPWYEDTGYGLEIRGGGLDQELNEPKVHPGRLVIVSVWTRLSEPPRGAKLFIQDRTDKWAETYTNINDTTWQQQVVMRHIRPEATEVIFGLAWGPQNDRQWFDIKNLRVFVLNGNGTQANLSHSLKVD